MSGCRHIPGPKTGAHRATFATAGPLGFPGGIFGGARWCTHKSPPGLWRDLSPVSAKPTKLPSPLSQKCPPSSRLSCLYARRMLPPWEKKQLAIRMKRKFLAPPAQKGGILLAKEFFWHSFGILFGILFWHSFFAFFGKGVSCPL